MIEGFGLHTGARSAVRFERHEGPVVVRAGGVDVALAELEVVDTERSTTIASADGRVRITTVEHVFAALGGLGIHGGVAVIIDGGEPPLADGGARTYVDALLELGVRSSGAPLRVARAGTFELGASRYELVPQESVALEVSVDFADPRIAEHARWDGDPDDFRVRIARARTFGFEHEVATLMAKGLASHVTPDSVVVVGKDRVLSSGAPFTADEPARHKLVDLVGDLYLYGGPPRGLVRARRPGHAATHEMMRHALAAGLLSHDP